MIDKNLIFGIHETLFEKTLLKLPQVQSKTFHNNKAPNINFYYNKFLLNKTLLQ